MEAMFHAPANPVCVHGVVHPGISTVHDGEWCQCIVLAALSVDATCGGGVLAFRHLNTTRLHLHRASSSRAMWPLFGSSRTRVAPFVVALVGVGCAFASFITSVRSDTWGTVILPDLHGSGAREL